MNSHVAFSIIGEKEELVNLLDAYNELFLKNETEYDTIRRYGDSYILRWENRSIKWDSDEGYTAQFGVMWSVCKKKGMTGRFVEEYDDEIYIKNMNGKIHSPPYVSISMGLSEPK